MSKFSGLAAAGAAALLAACAGAGGMRAEADAAGASATATYTDAQLRSFASAAVEIDPISRTLATATPEQRTAAVTRIRTILARNNIDEATYNAIAARASADPTFAARIRTLHEAHG